MATRRGQGRRAWSAALIISGLPCVCSEAWAGSAHGEAAEAQLERHWTSAQLEDRVEHELLRDGISLPRLGLELKVLQAGEKWLVRLDGSDNGHANERLLPALPVVLDAAVAEVTAVAVALVRLRLAPPRAASERGFFTGYEIAPVERPVSEDVSRPTVATGSAAEDTARARQVIEAPRAFEPDPARSWYGWQVLVADSAIVAGALKTGWTPAFGLLAVAAPAIHTVHGGWRRGLLSLGLRAGGAAAGASLGIIVAGVAGSSIKDGAGVSVLGVLAALVVDAAGVAWDEVPSEPATRVAEDDWPSFTPALARTPGGWIAVVSVSR